MAQNEDMTRHKIVVKRNAFGGMSQGTIGTDALNALSQMPGVIDACIEAEDDEQVTVSYIYTLTEKLLDTVTHLAKFNLERDDWNQ
jgi:hypothetical protein